MINPSVDFLTAPGCGGALTVPERMLIKEAAWQMATVFGPTFRAVNIGVDKGGTLWCIRAGAPDCELIGVDINPESERGDWCFLHGDSRCLHTLVSPPVHLLLVDGDHDYYGVRADILIWTPKIATGGIVIFHDYGNGEKYPWTAGVKRAVDEQMTVSDWEIGAMADSIVEFRRR